MTQIFEHGARLNPPAQTTFRVGDLALMMIERADIDLHYGGTLEIGDLVDGAHLKPAAIARGESVSDLSVDLQSPNQSGTWVAVQRQLLDLGSSGTDRAQWITNFRKIAD